MQPIRIKQQQRPFTAARDENGVSHIHAPTWHDALFGLGFMHGFDRPTQILFSRSVASGRSAAEISNREALVETDRFFRRVGLDLRLQEEVDALDEEIREALCAYCHGVNNGMQQSGRSLPMWATGFQPDTWDPGSVMLIGNLLNFAGLAVGQQQQERLIVELIQVGVEPDLLRELFSPMLDEADFELLRQVKISSRLSDEAIELMADLPRLAGSNAWAMSGSRTASGNALLAADPHLEINRLPAIWYEVALHWENQYVMGASLPGCPSFGIGRTREVSWGVTYLKGDTSDYFVEDCREYNDRWQYRRGDQWHDFHVRREEIERKGADPLLEVVHYNDLGILASDPSQSGPGYYLSTAWGGSQQGAGDSIAAWLQMAHARSADEGMQIARACPQPTLRWVFADREGHIGIQAGGWFPERPPHVNGLYPVPAWDEANHWQGRIPPERLPGELDPPCGFVATANEAVDLANGAKLVTLPTPDYRKRRIDERLEDLDQATIEEMQSVQYDLISLQARDLLEVFLPHLPDGELKDRLSAWDCSYPPESLEATLFTRLYRRVLLEIFGQPEGGIGWRRMLYLCTRAGFSIPVVTAIDNLLHQEQSRWWAGRDKGELIRRAAEKMAGEPEIPWGMMNAFKFTNRFFEGQLVGRALGFHSADMPMPGCHATPFQGHLLRVATRESTFAPSYHFVTDLGTDEAWTNMPGGPSESRFSRWYKSDIPRWVAGHYKRLAPMLDDETAET